MAKISDANACTKCKAAVRMPGYDWCDVCFLDIEDRIEGREPRIKCRCSICQSRRSA